MLEFKERRDEARDLLATLLSWVFSTYMSELLSLSLEAGFEEFAESGMHQRALRQMVRQRGGKTTEQLTLGTAHTWNPIRHAPCDLPLLMTVRLGALDEQYLEPMTPTPRPLCA